MSTETKPAKCRGFVVVVLFVAMSLAPPETASADEWQIGGAADRGMTYDPWAPPDLPKEPEPGISQGGTLGYSLQPLMTQSDSLKKRGALDKWPSSGFSQNFTTDQGTMSGLMAQGFYDLAITPRWRLFAGAGLGMARLPANQQLDLGSLYLKRDPVTRDQNETVMTYQGMVGLSYEFSSPFQMYFGYRFFAADPLDPGSRNEGGERLEAEGHAAHSGLIGFRFNF